MADLERKLQQLKQDMQSQLQSTEQEKGKALADAQERLRALQVHSFRRGEGLHMCTLRRPAHPTSLFRLLQHPLQDELSDARRDHSKQLSELQQKVTDAEAAAAAKDVANKSLVCAADKKP